MAEFLGFDPAGNRSFELQDETFLSNGPAAVRVGEADGVVMTVVYGHLWNPTTESFIRPVVGHYPKTLLS